MCEVCLQLLQNQMFKFAPECAEPLKSFPCQAKPKTISNPLRYITIEYGNVNFPRGRARPLCAAHFDLRHLVSSFFLQGIPARSGGHVSSVPASQERPLGNRIRNVNRTARHSKKSFQACMREHACAVPGGLTIRVLEATNHAPGPTMYFLFGEAAA